MMFLVTSEQAGVSCRKPMRLWLEMPAFAGMTELVSCNVMERARRDRTLFFFVIPGLDPGIQCVWQAVTGKILERATGIEPATPSLGSSCSAN